MKSVFPKTHLAFSSWSPISLRLRVKERSSMSTGEGHWFSKWAHSLWHTLINSNIFRCGDSKILCPQSYWRMTQATLFSKTCNVAISLFTWEEFSHTCETVYVCMMISHISDEKSVPPATGWDHSVKLSLCFVSIAFWDCTRPQHRATSC